MSILPYLETFAAVVDKGSFTAAAEGLDISKPVVSKQVSQLEKYLGVQLLHRTTRRLHLTEAGEVFARYSQRIVVEAREAEQSVLPMQSEPRGTLGAYERVRRSGIGDCSPICAGVPQCTYDPCPKPPATDP